MSQANTSRALRSTAFIFVLASAQACTKWIAPTEPLPEAFARDTGQLIHVRERDGTLRLIHSPRLKGDTLFGVQGEDVRIAIPMKDVASIQVERRDKARTFGFALGIIAIATLVFFGIRAIFQDSYDRNP